jgi:uncharacterized protein (TIGR00725 family)
MRKKQVVVIGSSALTGHDSSAFELGRYIAHNGWILVSGGRGGVMESASRGASREGGIVIGILPFDSFDGANPFCTAVIPTGIGFARNSINVLAGDVVVALGGQWGTLSEIAYAMQYRKPLVCCTFTGGWAESITGFPEAPGMYRAGSLEEAFRLLSSLLS